MKKTNKPLIILIIIVVVALVYVIGTKDGEMEAQQQTISPSPSTSASPTVTKAPVVSTQPTSTVTPTAPVSYINDGEQTPVITSISPDTVDRPGNIVTITGKYLNGFEGETIVVITNKFGYKGYISAKSIAPKGATTISFSLPNQICGENVGASGRTCSTWMGMAPGDYEVYVQPWSKPSNKVTIRVMM